MEKLKDLGYERRYQILCERIEARGNPLVNSHDMYAIGIFANPIDIADIEPFLDASVFKFSKYSLSNVIQIFQTEKRSTGKSVSSYLVFGNGLARSETDRFDFLFWLNRDRPLTPKYNQLLYGVKFEDADRILDTVNIQEEQLRVTAKLERLYAVFRKRYAEWKSLGMSIDVLAGWVPGFSQNVYDSIILQSLEDGWGHRK